MIFDRPDERLEYSLAGRRHLLFTCTFAVPQIVFMLLLVTSRAFESQGGMPTSPVFAPLALFAVVVALLHWILTGIAIVSGVILTVRPVEALKKQIAWGAVSLALIADVYIRATAFSF